VCGLCGGAGATTLSYLLAHHLTRRDERPVLVCDTAGPTGGLAHLSGVTSPWTLPELAARLADEQPLTGGAFALDPQAGSAGRELRVIAAGPRTATPERARGLEALLRMARTPDAHARVIVDCGVPAGPVAASVVGSASHVAWVLPASSAVVAHAGAVLDALGAHPSGCELIVGRRDPAAGGAALKPVKALAERRQAPLVLVPALPNPHADLGHALGVAEVALTAIEGLVSR
jgi:hypothetical protein